MQNNSTQKKRRRKFLPHCRTVVVNQKPFVWIEVERICTLKNSFMRKRNQRTEKITFP